MFSLHLIKKQLVIHSKLLFAYSFTFQFLGCWEVIHSHYVFDNKIYIASIFVYHGIIAIIWLGN